ncbi:Serine/threonine-protein phosphatase 2A activator 2 [Taphrina deformans PYCC 5710]|uniref:Serine/threonine-protein phosphatase 2A activator n=1 Tax=Taphrina deformans (strain PYCC 5710 / ATCC 11124 / CBS 356.35 / IMI 108563 / JCM 9778 / NBRC 8474) TaxID=1097556 RepID=R4XAX4_TAPDE|nr:Serine/threonine-protein phosphatase 2A activator 2 [Taphrina deformans PYCC 5710]|eukprot:CCG82973.1 Serine/threonine-protein phosphatase 2A activator 2 [Taphrina deformans PYCC 5710]
MTYEIPRRRILTQTDLDLFQTSDAYTELLAFIEELNTSILGCPNSSECDISPTTEKVVEILESIQAKLNDHPAVDNNLSRFGNPAFRDFYDDIMQSTNKLHQDLDLPEGSATELGGYLTESFGNRTRIDYGSGHELNFLCYLLCLRKLNRFQSRDSKAVVLKILWKYIAVMRAIQSTYWLEPAGSHGVWGLDDYHFLPFLFGAGQLVGHRHLRPKSIHEPDLLDMYGKEYMYLACIQFINSIKTASLRWHSPMLDDISSAKSWEKINNGMIKMYKAEVLSKVPIMQHFLFGSLIKAADGMSPAPALGEDGTEHIHNTWADCCGIKVPSAIAAKQADGGEKIRRMDWG